MEGGEATVRERLRTSVGSLPEDSFFLGPIPRTEHQGIAYLRVLRELSASAIAVRADELRDKSAQGRRIGRIKSPYKYSLTQRLGAVFADIGLPPEYDDHKKNWAVPSKVPAVQASGREMTDGSDTDK